MANPDAPGFAFDIAEFIRRLVAVVFRLVRAVRRYAEVFGLGLGELGQHDADLLQVQAGDFFVELLGQTIEGLLVLVLVRPMLFVS